jgi:uncharacterized protein
MIIAFICGILFALVAQYARLNTFDKIISAALLRESEVAQILLSAVAVSSLVFFVEHALGMAPLSIKPLNLVGVSLGGIVFGVGVALLGYCPGTLLMALGEGNMDALSGYVGGLLAGAAYTLFYPVISPLLGPGYGQLSLHFNSTYATGCLVLFYSAFLIGLARFMGRYKTPTVAKL